MAKSVWVVSNDEPDFNYAIAVFTTRREMLKSLKNEFPKVKIHYSGDLPSRAEYVKTYPNGSEYTIFLELRRFKLNDWTVKP